MMSWLDTLTFVPRPPDSRPMGIVEQDILDELEFHVEMRTRDNVIAGMPAAAARQDAIRRFGDFNKIRKACRRALLGERIMLQRVQAVLTLVLLGAVIFLGVALYRGQQANEAATARLVAALERVAKQPAAAGAEAKSEAVAPSSPDQLFPRDAKLNTSQRWYRDKTEEGFKGMLHPPYVNRGAEVQCIEMLSNADQQMRIAAINALAIMGSKKAVPGLLKIAADRAEKDNRDRWMAVRALGIIGDPSVVLELVHLTYHYNQNTRFWAQISLVRLTGENFGRDVAAWKVWWEKQGRKPAISTETVAWATNPETLPYADPKKQDEFDAITAKPEDNAAAPSVVATVPRTADRNVDPALTEIRVTYDRQMLDGNWSWCYDSTQLKTTGKPRYEADGKTCVLPVKLEPGKVYTISLNSESFHNFKDVTGHPAVPYVLQFATPK
jgi:hypothetical protein